VTSNPNVHLIEDEQSFAAMAPRWRALLARCIDANTFLSHEWLYHWWTAYRPVARQSILLVEDTEGALIGIAPLMLARERRYGVPVRVLRYIGDGSSETDHMSFLLDRSAANAVRAVLFGAIGSLPWDVACFNQMPEGAENTAAWLDYARLNGWAPAIEQVPCPRCNLPDGHDALLARMPPRFRTSLRSARRRLQEAHQVEFGLHQRAEELPAALETLFRNHASRWQAKGQGGVFVDARKREFYARLSPALLASGMLRFFYLKLDGEIVAQEYCFEHDGTVMLLQEGFDYRFADRNVGNALRGFVFEHLIAQGAKVYDFLAGVSRHKQNWSDSAPNDLRIECARGLRGALYVQPPRIAAAIKDRLRPLRGRWVGSRRRQEGA
jgi:CelD/BcsL family acetyltransferase involved in cellulose biosynthesis